MPCNASLSVVFLSLRTLLKADYEVVSDLRKAWEGILSFCERGRF